MTFWTGNVLNAGTNANIYIKLYGNKGKSEEYTLNDRRDNFEQGSVDTFKVRSGGIQAGNWCYQFPTNSLKHNILFCPVSHLIGTVRDHLLNDQQSSIAI